MISADSLLSTFRTPQAQPLTLPCYWTDGDVSILLPTAALTWPRYLLTPYLSQQCAVKVSQGQRGGLSGPQHPAGRAVPLDAAHLQTQEATVVSRADHQPLALPAHAADARTHTHTHTHTAHSNKHSSCDLRPGVAAPQTIILRFILSHGVNPGELSAQH